MRVYKFYSRKWAKDALIKQRLKIATLDDLNDPFEFLDATSLQPEQRSAWHKAILGVFEKNGLISFSETWSNPVLWSHYGDRHFGAALGFDVSNERLRKVIYRSKRGKLPDLSMCSKDEKFRRMNLATHTKFKHWEYEQERRVFVTLNDADENGRFFKDFDKEIVLREFIIGARSKLTSAEVKEAQGDNGSIDIITTRLAFNSYKIVRQKRSDLQK